MPEARQQTARSVIGSFALIAGVVAFAAAAFAYTAGWFSPDRLTPHKLVDAFTPPGGAAARELDRLREAMVRVGRPDLMLDWLKNPTVRRTLQDVAARGAITHEALDALPPGRTLVHVRSMLVAAGALPARDGALVVVVPSSGLVVLRRA